MSEPDRGKRRLQKAPQFVEIDITAQCNQRCAYCSHFGSASDTGPDLPKEEWTALFQELSRSSVLSVTIGGGEPFIRNDIIEILEEVIRNKMRFDIGTNGTLITDEMARFLASTKRCNFVQVSIDGSNAEMHDIMVLRSRSQGLRALT
jgi:SynChlorMet cassette radical SAM/SPASM protein ScmE